MICIKFFVLVFLLLFQNLNTGFCQSNRIVCYYLNWSGYREGVAKYSPDKIDPFLCTHLLYAFAALDDDEGIRPFDPLQDLSNEGYVKFNNLKKVNPKLKTMLSIGGWNEGSIHFSSISSSPEKRAKFVTNAIKYINDYEFDGIDLVWQYPTFRDFGKPEDKVNYGLLVKELREAFDKECDRSDCKLFLSMAVPALNEYIEAGYDMQTINSNIDFMNVLAYDLHLASDPIVNHHAPLYALPEELDNNPNSELNVDWIINRYINGGIEPDKLVLGIPVYGRTYTLENSNSNSLGASSEGPGEGGNFTKELGYLAYYEICSLLPNNWTVVNKNRTAMGPYAFKDNQWISFDDADIVKKKGEYARNKQLGGLMFWAIDQDDFMEFCGETKYFIIKTGKEALYGTAALNVEMTTAEILVTTNILEISTPILSDSQIKDMTTSSQQKLDQSDIMPNQYSFNILNQQLGNNLNLPMKIKPDKQIVNEPVIKTTTVANEKQFNKNEKSPIVSPNPMKTQYNKINNDTEKMNFSFLNVISSPGSYILQSINTWFNGAD